MLLWVYVVLGAMVSVVAMLAISQRHEGVGVSALTFPFVLTTWLMLLATYGFAGLVGHALPSGSVVGAVQAYPTDPLDVVGVVQGVFRSISQVFLGSRASLPPSSCSPDFSSARRRLRHSPGGRRDRGRDGASPGRRGDS